MGNPHSVVASRKLRAIAICPVTGGLPTTMTLAGFKNACRLAIEQARPDSWDKRSYKHGWCSSCQGKKLPKELRVLSLDQIKKQRVTDKVMKVLGTRQRPQEG